MRIDPNFVATLPDDRDEAFFQMEEYLAAIRNANANNDDWNAEQFYVNGLHEFARFVSDEELQKATDVDILGFNEPWEGYSPIRNYVDRRRLRASFSIGARRRQLSASIGLTPDVRQLIQSYIANIRTALHNIDIPAPKKDAIFRALNKLALEVDTDRTWSEAIADLAIRLSDTVDEVDRKLNPVRRIFEKILKRLNEAKSEQEALDKPIDQPRIEGPKPSDGNSDGLDDEIPF